MRSLAARRSIADPHERGAGTVTSIFQLRRVGWTASGVRAQVDARRWQRVGRAVIKHNAEPNASELRQAALIVLGPRALLTSFTALEVRGLRSWTRDEVHVLVPRGARVTRPDSLALRVHYTDRWPDVSAQHRGDTSGIAHAAVLAASSFANVRPACAILAATVQQRLLRPAELVDELLASRWIRHHRALLAAANDICQGAQALSEIDFARLCRRHGLPEPVRQAVRRAPDGRRRYLDAEWKLRDGRRVIAEVDGALHLIARRWWDDQIRQNELAIAGDLALRFPTVVMRGEPELVVGQLARALGF